MKEKFYDEIEWFCKERSVYKTCLPELSTETLRIAIMNHGGVSRPDRMVIIDGRTGKIRLDSEKHLILRKELGIFKYQLVKNGKVKIFWGRMLVYSEELQNYIIQDVKTGDTHNGRDVSLDTAFYSKYHPRC